MRSASFINDSPLVFLCGTTSGEARTDIHSFYFWNWQWIGSIHVTPKSNLMNWNLIGITNTNVDYRRNDSKASISLKPTPMWIATHDSWQPTVIQTVKSKSQYKKKKKSTQNLFCLSTSPEHEACSEVILVVASHLIKQFSFHKQVSNANSFLIRSSVKMVWSS